MGALAKFGVSAGSKQFFDASMNPANKTMDFVRDHPMLTKMVAIAFPPARGAIMAAEIADTARSVLGGADRTQATQAWKKTQDKGLSLAEQFGQASEHIQQQKARQRERV